MSYDGDANRATDPYGMPARQPSSRRGMLALGFAVVGVVAFAGAVVVGFRGHDRLSGDGPPLLTADPGPVKARPDQPGGMEVPHQDILAYERLRDHGGKPAVERLLPPPEVPLPRPVVTPPIPAAPPLPVAPTVGQLPPPPPGATATVPRPEIAAAPAGQEAPAVAPSAGPPAASPAMPPAAVAAVPAAAPPPAKVQAPPAALPPANPAPVAAAPRPQPAKPAAQPAPPPQTAQQAAPPAIGQLIAKLDSAPQNRPPAAQPPASAQAHPAKTPAVSGGSGGWRVQLASVRSEAEAANEWRRIAGRYPDALGGLAFQVAKVDLAEKGIFYRVQGGGADETRAKSVCAQLRAQNVGCVVVRP